MSEESSGGLLSPYAAILAGLAVLLIAGGVLVSASVTDETDENPTKPAAGRSQSDSSDGCGCGG